VHWITILGPAAVASLVTGIITAVFFYGLGSRAGSAMRLSEEERDWEADHRASVLSSRRIPHVPGHGRHARPRNAREEARTTAVTMTAVTDGNRPVLILSPLADPSWFPGGADHDRFRRGLEAAMAAGGASRRERGGAAMAHEWSVLAGLTPEEYARRESTARDGSGWGG
jgi:hypothetical protein